MKTMLQALFGCRHVDLSRVFTISVKYPNGFRIRTSYVVCLCCGTQWFYDLSKMRRTSEVPR